MRQRMADALARTFGAFRDALSDDQRRRWDDGLRALATARRGVVWTLVDDAPRATAVRIGASDGTVTEVGGDLREGDTVLVGQERPAE
jgi:HlyD family secretion protein